MSDKKHTVCTECNVSHYDNCRTCFGFGVYRHGEKSPVSAHSAHAELFFGDVIPCPECGSTEHGLPPMDPVAIAENARVLMLVMHGNTDQKPLGFLYKTGQP